MGAGLSAWPGGGAEPSERGREVGGPGPIPVQAQDLASAGGDEPAGDVQDAVAQSLGLEATQRAGETERLGPGREVRSGQGELDPGTVGMEVLAGQVPQPTVLAVADPVLDTGVLTVPSSRATMSLPPPGVSVSRTWKRCPSMSVNRYCAPGCGRSRRQITRDPVGQALRSSRAVSSTISPFSRSSPSLLIAGCHALAGTSVIASWIF